MCKQIRLWPYFDNISHENIKQGMIFDFHNPNIINQSLTTYMIITHTILLFKKKLPRSASNVQIGDLSA